MFMKKGSSYLVDLVGKIDKMVSSIDEAVVGALDEMSDIDTRLEAIKTEKAVLSSVLVKATKLRQKLVGVLK